MAKKRDEKETVLIKDDIFAEKLNKFINLKENIDKETTKLENLKSFIREIGLSEFIKIVEKNEETPESFLLESSKGDSILFNPTKKYKTVSEKEIKLLKEKYGDDIISKDVEYELNDSIFKKYQKTIEDFIKTSSEISEDDKTKLIERIEKHSIEKEALTKLFNLSKDSKSFIKDVIDDIQPTIVLKSAKLKE